MPRHRIISADSHATIPQQYLLDTLPKKYHQAVKEAAPATPRAGPVSAGAKQTKAQIESELAERARRKAVSQGGDRPLGRAGGSDPVERIKDMDIDGVEAEVLHCVVGGAHVGVNSDATMRAEFVHAENEARRAWCATDPQRLIPVAVLPLENIDNAVKELEWLGREGFRVVEIPVYPDEVGLKPYFHEQWAPLWNIASDLEIPLHLHVGTNNGLSRIMGYDRTPIRTIYQSLPPIYMAECISSWILPGTFDRHPGMKVLLAEAGVTWIPYYLDRLDTMMVRHRLEKLEMLKEQPSFYWRRNMACSFEEDVNAKGHILDAVGVDNVLWATDYPHTDSPWPHSQEVVSNLFGDLPDADRAKIAAENAERLYKLAVPTAV